MTGPERPPGATGPATGPTTLRDRPTTDPARPLPGAPAFPDPPGPVAQWVRDLWMGVRFALFGGREGLLRTSLTALGVGCGVAVLLLAAAIPNLMAGREDRNAARAHDYSSAASGELAPGAGTVLLIAESTQFRGEWVVGRILHAEGDDPALPPGITEVPAPGTMAVSPALRDLLESPDAPLLTPRIPYEPVGLIGDEGLAGPDDLVWYAGDPTLVERVADGEDVERVDSFGVRAPTTPLDPVLLLLLVVGCVVLLLPVGAFIATAVRLGGERRDRRLAALRLLGTDVRATHRIAAGEAMAGALAGLLVGTVVFLLGRNLLAEFRIFGFSAFAGDAIPAWPIALLILIGVPMAAVMVTLQAMRRVAVEPLGVVRTSTPRRRRLWWRLLPPVAGLALLLPMMLSDSEEPQVGTGEIWQVAAGIVLLLVGATAVLPWLVEALTGRLRGGPVSFQLAVRRLQLDSGSASRAVSGVTIAVAGAVALQMFLTGIAGQFSEETGMGENSPSLRFSTTPGEAADALANLDALSGVTGVTGVVGYVQEYVPHLDDEEMWTQITIADCAALVRVIETDGCADGDVFLVTSEEGTVNIEPGGSVNLATTHDSATGEPLGTDPEPWTVPAETPRVAVREDGDLGYMPSGIYTTPAAFAPERLPSPRAEAELFTDPTVADVAEHVRNAAIDLGSNTYLFELSPTIYNDTFDDLRRALYAGAVIVMILIGASLAISTLEQMRERRRLLSVLVAFGTRRSTLAGSVLWQTALPVALGLLLALVGGMGLGAVLLTMVDVPVAIDVPSMVVMVAAGAAVILAATLAGMPSLYRMMRPQGLRTE
ncbi:FtsX-like permease family protein [Streptomyces sp. ST2-7A]|uniref:FtsX-like permease family protein n=1 Tax=Streptomyces sp. ST2-7A TaxID=2907214 RepID=UPI001F2DD077|nr:FtsX-like permease family protein [Streptomyces sp. ST2-7A]MCE7082118.1 ABC transporter permease [Streptomyces sp. ST2-7A]